MDERATELVLLVIFEAFIFSEFTPGSEGDEAS
jgi:hypothetical protein